MSNNIPTGGESRAEALKVCDLTAETAFPLGVSGLGPGITPNVLDGPDQPAEHNLNGYPDLKTLLSNGEGLYNKWHVVSRIETKTPFYKQSQNDIYPGKNCPTRACASCGEKRVLQQYTRSHEPYDRIDTNHAVCNSCKHQKQGIRHTREDFHRQYLGFEGVWPYSEGLWVPWYV